MQCQWAAVCGAPPCWPTYQKVDTAMTSSPTTSEQILASARGFIVSGGYNAFSYADIAAAIGIRKASIHHHFPSKVDLVRTVVRQYRDEAALGLTRMAANVADPEQRLQLYVGYWARCIEDASFPFCVCVLLASELPALPSDVVLEVRAHFQTLTAWLTAVIELGIEQGRLQVEAPAKVEAELLVATVHGAMLSARAHGDPVLFNTILQPALRRLSARTQ